MVMLPGGGVCYRGAIPIAEEMAKVYHVVLVAYDGFNPDEPGTEYKSTLDEAKRLGDYVVEHCGGKIDILYGVSYGTFVLMDVLADRRLTITTTIADAPHRNIAMYLLTSIINTVYSNIHTRIGEIGMQRAIGMSAASLYKTFLWEGAYYGIFASVIGAVLGYVCCIFVGAAQTDTLQLVAVPVAAILEAAAVSVAACLAATAIPLRTISRMSIVD